MHGIYADMKNIIILLLFLFLFFISNNMDFENYSNIQTSYIQTDPWLQVGLDTAWGINRDFYRRLTEILYTSFLMYVCRSFLYIKKEVYLRFWNLVGAPKSQKTWIPPLKNVWGFPQHYALFGRTKKLIFQKLEFLWGIH